MGREKRPWSQCAIRCSQPTVWAALLPSTPRQLLPVCVDSALPGEMQVPNGNTTISHGPQGGPDYMAQVSACIKDLLSLRPGVQETGNHHGPTSRSRASHGQAAEQGMAWGLCVGSSPSTGERKKARSHMSHSARAQSCYTYCQPQVRVTRDTEPGDSCCRVTPQQRNPQLQK